MIEKRKINLSYLHDLKKILRSVNLYTVCEEARCPNIVECFSKGTSTFMIMGDTCTRDCKFCNVKTGTPKKLDTKEASNILKATRLLKLKHVVITSVTRDDLADGGALHFYNVIKKVKQDSVTVEVLTSDFKENYKSIDKVLSAKPDIFNHNVETVKRLSKVIRPQASYNRSLRVLKYAKDRGFITKSGFMLGLGEKEDEIYETIKDIKKEGVDVLTIGQYFAPKKSKFPVKKFYEESFFNKLSDFSKKLGFKYVFSGIYVRSSYMASEVLKK
jgi:lipoyl synthase